jgi:hypothetical protein
MFRASALRHGQCGDTRASMTSAVLGQTSALQRDVFEKMFDSLSLSL